MDGKPIIQIGKIYIDEAGVYWCYWQGTHNDQGGPQFTGGNLGMEDPEGLMKIVGSNIAECKDLYLDEIKQRVKGQDDG